MCCPLPKLTFVSSVSLMLEGESGAWPGQCCQAPPSITIRVGLINIWHGARPVLGWPRASRCGGAQPCRGWGWWLAVVGLVCRPRAGGFRGGAGHDRCPVNGRLGLCSALCSTSFARLGAQGGPFAFPVYPDPQGQSKLSRPRALPALPPRPSWEGASWRFSEPAGAAQ